MTHPRTWVEETLRLAGIPATPANIAALRVADAIDREIATHRSPGGGVLPCMTFPATSTPAPLTLRTPLDAPMAPQGASLTFQGSEAMWDLVTE